MNKKPMDLYLKCVVCGKEVLLTETNKWFYHRSWDGPKCSTHEDVREEYDRLLKEEAF